MMTRYMLRIKSFWVNTSVHFYLQMIFKHMKFKAGLKQSQFDSKILHSYITFQIYKIDIID